MATRGSCAAADRIDPASTLMFREAAESAAVVRRQRQCNADVIGEIGARLRATPPRAVVTLARGSSDHAATFARYVFELRAGVLTSSASPSIASLYRARVDFSDTLVLAISQSGRSPDLLAAAEQARATGALVIAITNDSESPLAGLADFTLGLSAGPERSVAASKSFVASLAAILDLLARWTADPQLDRALCLLPDQLDAAWQLDWTAALPLLEPSTSMYVIGRGPGLAIAQEAALKLKETCGIHAEAFSAAEVRHGPMALVRRGFPVLLFGQPDESLDSLGELAAEFAGRGAIVISAGLPGASGLALRTIEADPLTAPILQIASFYRLANALAVVRGFDPDRPPYLSKVTETR